MKYKKIIIFIIAIVTVFSSFTVFAFADEADYQSNNVIETGVYYTIDPSIINHPGMYAISDSDNNITGYYRLAQFKDGKMEFLEYYFTHLFVYSGNVYFLGYSNPNDFNNSNLGGWLININTVQLGIEILDSVYLVWFGDCDDSSYNLPYSDSSGIYSDAGNYVDLCNSLNVFSRDLNVSIVPNVFYELDDFVCETSFDLIICNNGALTSYYRVFDLSTNRFIDGYFANLIVETNTYSFYGCSNLSDLLSSDFKGYDVTITKQLDYSCFDNYLFIWFGDSSSTDYNVLDYLHSCSYLSISNYSSTEIYYQMGFDDGHDTGYNQGTVDGYNEGFTTGYTSGFEEGKNEGYQNGRAEGYEQGYNAATELLNTPSTVGHYYGAKISFYTSNRPHESNLVYSHVIDTDNYSRIFNFADLSLILNNYVDFVASEMYIEVVFPDYVDFLANPLSIYNVSPGDYRPITDFVDIYIGSPSDDGFSDGVYLCRIGDFDFYYPNRGYEHRHLGFYIKDLRGFLKYLHLTNGDDVLLNSCYLSNKRFQTFRLDAEYIDQIKSESYQHGLDSADTSAFIDGREYGYNEGYNAALEMKGGSFIELFDGIANTPITVLRSVLGFEIFGMNVLGTLLGLLTIGIVIFIIRKFI